jgi:hypothetical protein
MPVIIASKTDYTGTVTPSDLNVETNVVDIGAQSEDYIVEGYLDISALQSGDVLEVREYIAVDGANPRQFIKLTYSGAQDEPIIRFHAKVLYKTCLYRVTVKQTAGTVRSFPYAFVLEVMGVTG